MHGLQVESELFRRGACQENAEQEEEDYAEYQRRMRQAAKEKSKQPAAAPPQQQPATTAQQPATATSAPPPQQPSFSMSIQSLLEDEHDVRVASRATLEEREHRLEAVVSDALSGRPSEGATSGPVTVEELRGVLKANERAQAAETTEFVGSYISVTTV